MGFKAEKADIANDIIDELGVGNAQEKYFLWEQLMKMNKKSLSCLRHYIVDKMNHILESK